MQRWVPSLAWLPATGSPSTLRTTMARGEIGKRWGTCDLTVVTYKHTTVMCHIIMSHTVNLYDVMPIVAQ